MDAIYVRPDRCMGCRSCEIGCAVEHSKGKTFFTALLESPPPRKRLFVEAANGNKMPVVCRHCEDAPCLNACVGGSLYRDDEGFVQRREERCIGCWSCVMTCPFGVMTRNAVEGVALKCDGCREREIPSCVTACPTRTLVLADMETLPREKRYQLFVSE